MPKGSSSKSTAAIQRLLEERRQYEAWLARLDQAADGTPAGVRSRVRADYQARLLAVTEELKSHAEAARQLILQRKEFLKELQKKEARASEVLTETELRHTVGEYDESQWSQVHKDALSELVSIREEIASTTADIAQLEELDSLVRAKPGAGEKPLPRVGPPPKPGEKRPEPRKQMVDELAFLKSVTEDDRNAPSPKRASGAQFQPAIPADSTRAVPSSSPATPTPNADDDDPEPERTLKCRECGTMNLPTEWYCESCGAELAAL
jgi:flagellar biosynthesis/type III secretory pathway chaperone